MKLIKIAENDSMEYDYLLLNYINIITFSAGTLILPKTTELGQLTILFKERGKFKIKAADKKINFGSEIFCEGMINPGSAGFDTQPTFIHCDDLWFLLSPGLFVLNEKE